MWLYARKICEDNKGAKLNVILFYYHCWNVSFWRDTQSSSLRPKKGRERMGSLSELCRESSAKPSCQTAMG